MRVISGIYKGRNIQGFHLKGTRPTQERVKESIFAMIQESIPNAIILDLFAGSGNLGIEALSNGASHVYFVDNSKEAVSIIRKNLENFQIENASVYKMDYQKALIEFSNHQIKFDIVFVDPPYKDFILEKILENLAKRQLLKENARIVLEYEVEQTAEDYPSFLLEKQKKYGFKNVKIYLYQKER